MDLKKLSRGDQIMGGAGVLLFLFSFFPWWGKKVGDGFISASYSESGWGGFLGLLGILIGLAVVVVLVLDKLTTVKLPDLPLPWNQVYLIASCVSAALILLEFLVGRSESGIDLDRRVGAFLGLLAAIGMAVGAFLRTKEPQTGSTPPTSF